MGKHFDIIKDFHVEMLETCGRTKAFGREAVATTTEKCARSESRLPPLPTASGASTKNISLRP